MGRLIQDLRFAVRTFLRGRSVTLLSVLAFALGIGVTTAVFSIFNSVLLSPAAVSGSRRAGHRLRHAARAAPPARPRSRSITIGRAAIRCSRRSADRRGLVRLTGSGDPERVARHVDDRVADRRLPRAAGHRPLVYGTGRPARTARRSSCSPTSSGRAASIGDPSVIGRRADPRRRAVRGDRRHAARASPIATRISSCRCSASSIRRTRGNHFLEHLRAAEEGRHASIARRPRCARSAGRSRRSSATTTASTCARTTRWSSATSARRCRFCSARCSSCC